MNYFHESACLRCFNTFIALGICIYYYLTVHPSVYVAIDFKLYRPYHQYFTGYRPSKLFSSLPLICFYVQCAACRNLDMHNICHIQSTTCQILWELVAISHLLVSLSFCTAFVYTLLKRWYTKWDHKIGFSGLREELVPSRCIWK